jgi:hypothetical protein
VDQKRHLNRVASRLVEKPVGAKMFSRFLCRLKAAGSKERRSHRNESRFPKNRDQVAVELRL